MGRLVAVTAVGLVLAGCSSTPETVAPPATTSAPAVTAAPATDLGGAVVCKDELGDAASHAIGFDLDQVWVEPQPSGNIDVRFEYLGDEDSFETLLMYVQFRSIDAGDEEFVVGIDFASSDGSRAAIFDDGTGAKTLPDSTISGSSGQYTLSVPGMYIGSRGQLLWSAGMISNEGETVLDTCDSPGSS